jgi:hypothetical protein
LEEYVEAVKHSYRKDYWHYLPDYVHIIVEKDAIAGTLQEVTERYSVALSPIRGSSSWSFANEIAEVWQQIDKPIHAYYLGDFDPKGFDIERDIKARLEEFWERTFTWERLAVNVQDFEDFKLLPLPVKETDTCSRTFIREHGCECAELDAIPPNELRRRVEEAIKRHISEKEWKKLQRIEQLEKESVGKVLAKLNSSLRSQ